MQTNDHASLIRHEVTATMRAHDRACAVELLSGDVTPATWRVLAAECESLSARRSGAYVRRAVAETCERMACGDVDGAVERMARECGMSADEWAQVTREEMAGPVAPEARPAVWTCCGCGGAGCRACGQRGEVVASW